MSDISFELEELDRRLLQAEKEPEKGLSDITKSMLLLFILRMSEGNVDFDVNNVFNIPDVFQRDLANLYSNYFNRIVLITEQYTKQELLNLAKTVAERKRIERLISQQRTYNNQYARKLAKKQIDDLKEGLSASVLKFREENPDASLGSIKNFVRDKTKTFDSLRGSITAATEANRVANQTRLDLYRKSKIVGAVRFTAVLDKRTTPTCRSRNGTVIPLDSNLIMSYTPPLHPRCRSYLVPVGNVEEANDYSDLKDINNAEPVTPTAEVVDSW